MSDAVGIAVVEEAPGNLARVAAPSKHCALVRLARRGQTLYATSDDISCPIARHVLGCDLTGAGRQAAAASFVESKLVKDSDAALRFVEGFTPLEPRRRVFVYFPAQQAPVPADVVIRFLAPEEAMKRLRALVTATGERAQVRTAGSATICADCTAAPLLSGRAAFSPGCPGSRREVPLTRDEVLVSFPARLERAANAG
jgi:uncharacterized protein (DUF169 family)